MVTKFQRFKDFAAMAAWVQGHIDTFEGPWQVEPMPYNEGVWVRPSVTLFNKYEIIHMKWYAYADEEGIDFLGPRARLEARAKGNEYCDKLVGLVDGLKKL